MITYKIKFQAKQIGAIGKLQTYKRTVNATDEEQAVKSLYSHFEHIHVIECEGNKTQLRNQRKANEIAAHIKAIGNLLSLCNADGKLRTETVSNRLRSIEHFTSKSAEDYCNGVIDSDEWDYISNAAYKKIQTLFNNNLKGLYINSDARGYALKIQTETMQDEYQAIGLQKDWGGYGLLAPEINANN